MSASDEYRRHAAECLRAAERTTDLAARVALLDVARAWHSLADQAERNRKTDLVYETPPPPAGAQPAVVQQQQQQQPKKDDSSRDD
jgi:hypothetical protein